MSERKIQQLQNKIDKLNKDNKTLKVKISRMRKLVNKSANIILNSYESHENDTRVIRDKVKTCEECGKGELKLLELLDMKFEICQLCRHRKKISSNKK